MIRFLVEGASDVPVLREVCVRGLGLVQGSHFQVYWHRGKGILPANPDHRPAPNDQTLLGQLPTKLRAYGKADPRAPIVVVVDADRDSCIALKASLTTMLGQINPRPATVLFRIAVEETESWLIADHKAMVTAYPGVDIAFLRAIAPDAIVGAWERLAESLGRDPERCTGADKEQWAKDVSPHMELATPNSPSFSALVRGLERITGLQV